jgi:hypothetical protein
MQRRWLEMSKRSQVTGSPLHRYLACHGPLKTHQEMVAQLQAQHENLHLQGFDRHEYVDRLDPSHLHTETEKVAPRADH